MTIARSLLATMCLAMIAGQEYPSPELIPVKPKPRPRDTNSLCDECEFLSLTEKKQTNKNKVHMCTKYNERVFHFGRQPKIFRCNKCFEANNYCVGNMTGRPKPDHEETICP